MRISLTGDVTIAHDGREVSGRALGGRQVRLALALLVLERHRPVLKEELADLLWPDRLPANWQVALRGVVARLRGALALAGWDPSDALTTHAGSYRLRLPLDVVVDIEELSADVDAAEAALAIGNRVGALAHAAAAVAHGGRFLLPGDDEPWLDRRRGELQAQLVRGLATLAQAAADSEDTVAAVEIAGRLVELDPFSETGHRLLVQAYASAGDRIAATHAFERYRELLAREIGASPAPETVTARRNALLDAPTTRRDRGSARRPGDVTRLRHEGDKAMREKNPALAAEHYAAAAAAAARARQIDAQVNLLIDTGHARKLAGDPAAAERALLAAASMARDCHDSILLGRAAVTLAGAERITPRATPEPLALIDEALAGLPPRPTALRAVLLARRAQYLAHDARLDELESTSRLAAEVARACGMAEALVDALVARLQTLAGPARAGERLAVAGEILDRGKQHGATSTRLQALESQVFALVELGEWKAATAAMDHYRSEADAAALPQARWFASQHRICRLVVAGLLADCEAAVDASVALGREVVDERVATGSGVMHRLVPWWLTGRLAELGDPVQQIADWLGHPPRSRASLALLAVAAHDQREARRLLRGVLAEADALPSDANWAPTMFYLALACLEVGTRTQAAELRSRLLPLIGRHGSFQGLTYYGAYALLTGSLARIAGALDEASAELDIALKHHETIAAAPWVVMSRSELSATLYRRGRRGDQARARRLRTAGDLLAAEIGMSTWEPARGS